MRVECWLTNFWGQLSTAIVTHVSVCERRFSPPVNNSCARQQKGELLQGMWPDLICWSLAAEMNAQWISQFVDWPIISWCHHWTRMSLHTPNSCPPDLLCHSEWTSRILFHCFFVALPLDPVLRPGTTCVSLQCPSRGLLLNKNLNHSIFTSFQDCYSPWNCRPVWDKKATSCKWAVVSQHSSCCYLQVVSYEMKCNSFFTF